MADPNEGPWVCQVSQLIPRIAIDDSAVEAIDFVRRDAERQLAAAVGETPIIEERETRRYYDRNHRQCAKSGEWSYMELRIAWYLESPPAVPTP